MTIDHDAMRAAIAKLPRKDRALFGPAGPEFMEWLARHDAPAWLVEFFRHYAIRGRGLMHVPDRLDGEDKWPRDNELEPSFWQQQLMVLGYCGNGDAVVLDFSAEDTGSIGYCCHETLYNNVGDFRGCREIVAPSLAAFLVGLTGRSQPGDYFAVRERRLPRRRSEYEGPFGYIDVSGRWVVKPEYDEGIWCSEGRVSVKSRGKWGAFDPDGRLAIPFRFDSLWVFKDRLCGAKIDGAHGYVDPRGAFVIQPRFASADWFSDGLGKVSVGKGDRRFGYVRADGSFAIEPVHRTANRFSEGVARVADPADPAATEYSAARYAYIDTTGEIAFGPYAEARDFHDGLTTVLIGRDTRVLRRDGVVLPIENVRSWEPRCGRVIVWRDGYVGFVDAEGKPVTPVHFNDAADFADGAASVKAHRRWGAIAPDGTLIVPLRYDERFDFSDGLALVHEDGKPMFIDKRGEVVLRPTDAVPVQNFRGGLAKAQPVG